MNYLKLKTESAFSNAVVTSGSVLIFAEQTDSTVTLKAKLTDGTFVTVSGGGGGGEPVTVDEATIAIYSMIF